MIYHAQIPGAEHKCSSLGLFNRHVFTGAGLLRDIVLPSARMSACTPVGISSRHICGQKTSSRIRDAHRAVHECFYLHILGYILTDLAYLFERKLPSDNDPSCALSVPEIACGIVGIVGLGGNMDHGLGEICDTYVIHSRIRYEYRIGRFLHGAKLPEIFGSFIKIMIVCHYIGGHIYLYAYRMRFFYAVRHLIRRKIARLGPEGKEFPSHIYRIGTVMKSRFKCIRSSRGNEKLGLFSFFHA